MRVKSSEDQALYDVIISGAGPVGLFLACELALAKCSVLILEKAEAPLSPLKQLPFGMRGLSAPSVEALYRRGLVEELEVPKRQAARQGGHFAGIPFSDIDLTQWTHRLPSSTPVSMVSELYELEVVLARRAQALGVVIKRGLSTTGFLQTADGVSVRSESQAYNGKWLVGCDGSRSAVRKLAGIEFAGTEPHFTGYTTQITLVDAEKLKPGRNLTPTGMYMQAQPGYVVLQDFDDGAFHNSGRPITLQHVQEVLRRVSNTDVSISALHIATTWTDRARQATSYRQGRVFLAGDAAHIHSPLGGQGLNLGLGDAMNLGWKLAATIHNQAPSGLLDSYQAERHPVGVQVLDWSRAQVAVMKPDVHARAVNTIIRELMSTRDGSTYFAGRVWGIFTHYQLGGTHPLVGHSVPNFEFADGRKLGELMHDGQGILLDFNSHASLKALAGEYHRLQYVSGRATEQLGLSTVLLRPDGVVAWAAESVPDEASLREVAALWFSGRRWRIDKITAPGFAIRISVQHFVAFGVLAYV